MNGLMLAFLLATTGNFLSETPDIKINYGTVEIFTGSIFGHYEFYVYHHDENDRNSNLFRFAANQFFVRVSSCSYGFTWHYLSGWKYQRGG